MIGVLELLGQSRGVDRIKPSHGARVDKRAMPARQAENIRLHLAGMVFAKHLQNSVLTVGAGILDLDAILRLESGDEGTHHLIDDEVGVIDDLALGPGARHQIGGRLLRARWSQQRDADGQGRDSG